MSPPQEPSPTPINNFLVAWGILAPILGWYANFLFSSRINKRNRRNDFIAFLGDWRSKFDRMWPDRVKENYQIYIDGVHTFHGHINGTITDVIFKKKFIRHKELIGGIKGEEFQKKQDDIRDLIRPKIDDLIRDLRKIK